MHPSGKLALTVGHDDCLALVNLVRGRRSFFCKLSKEASIVQFDGTGERFFMVTDDKISVHEAENAKLIFELDNKKKVLCAASGAVRSYLLHLFLLILELDNYFEYWNKMNCIGFIPGILDFHKLYPFVILLGHLITW